MNSSLGALLSMPSFPFVCYDGEMKAFSFLIKPASSSCNMRCRYCFYEDISSIREISNMGIMTRETEDRLIEWAFSSMDDDDSVSFAFQGGEPTMAGLDYFRHFVEKVNSVKKESQRVSYALQTNCYGINEEWAAFFRANNFLLGISVDGNRSLHDRYRINVRGEGTYLRIMDNLKILSSYGVEYNALCVVTGKTDAVKAYSSLKREGFRFLQFIPCLDPYEEERGGRDFSLGVEEYASFLCTLFDLWYRDWRNGKYVSVRLFDDYVHLLMGEPPSSCSVLGRCGGYIVTEADGSIYPCDFYVLDEWKIGLFSDYESISDVYQKSSVMRKFLSSGSVIPSECTECQYRVICNGGCRRDRDYLGTLGANYYCASYKKFFSYAAARLSEIAKMEISYRKSMNDK